MAADFFIGESLVGDGNEIAHIDLIIGSKSGPAGAAFTHALSNNNDGFSTLLAVVTPEPSLQARHAALQQGHHQGRQAGGADVRPGAGGRRPRGHGFGERGRHLEDARPTTSASWWACSSTGRPRTTRRSTHFNYQAVKESIARALQGQADRRRGAREVQGRAASVRQRRRGLIVQSRDSGVRRGAARGRGRPSYFSRTVRLTRRWCSAMRKLLLQLDSSRLPSVFDQVVAYDAGADVDHELRRRHRRRRPRSHPRLHLHPRPQGPAQHRGLDRRQQHVGGRAAPRHGAGRAVRAVLASRSCSTPTARTPPRSPRWSRSRRRWATSRARTVVILAGTGPVGQRAAGLLAKDGAQRHHHVAQAGAGRQGAAVHRRPVQRRRWRPSP